MKNQKIYLVRSTRVPLKDGLTIIEFFGRTPGPLEFTLLPQPLKVPLSEYQEIDWEPTFMAMRKLRTQKKLNENDILCLLTKEPNECSYFVVSETSFSKAMLPPLPNATPRNFFIHIDDETYRTNASRTTIAIHWILKKILDIHLEDHFENSFHLIHEEPRGCIFDFCRNKDDIPQCGFPLVVRLQVHLLRHRCHLRP